jgi:hypothetical protein
MCTKHFTVGWLRQLKRYRQYFDLMAVDAIRLGDGENVLLHRLLGQLVWADECSAVNRKAIKLLMLRHERIKNERDCSFLFL